jgi:hypothetical protein
LRVGEVYIPFPFLLHSYFIIIIIANHIEEQCCDRLHALSFSSVEKKNYEIQHKERGKKVESTGGEIKKTNNKRS